MTEHDTHIDLFLTSDGSIHHEDSSGTRSTEQINIILIEDHLRSCDFDPKSADHDKNRKYGETSEGRHILVLLKQGV